MLTQYYIAALIADEKAADLVRELWNSGEISDDLAALEWLEIAARGAAFAVESTI